MLSYEVEGIVEQKDLPSCYGREEVPASTMRRGRGNKVRDGLCSGKGKEGGSCTVEEEITCTHFEVGGRVCGQMENVKIKKSKDCVLVEGWMESGSETETGEGKRGSICTENPPSKDLFTPDVSHPFQLLRLTDNFFLLLFQE